MHDLKALSLDHRPTGKMSRFQASFLVTMMHFLSCRHSNGPQTHTCQAWNNPWKSDTRRDRWVMNWFSADRRNRGPVVISMKPGYFGDPPCAGAKVIKSNLIATNSRICVTVRLLHVFHFCNKCTKRKSQHASCPTAHACVFSISETRIWFNITVLWNWPLQDEAGIVLSAWCLPVSVSSIFISVLCSVIYVFVCPLALFTWPPCRNVGIGGRQRLGNFGVLIKDGKGSSLHLGGAFWKWSCLSLRLKLSMNTVKPKPTTLMCHGRFICCCDYCQINLEVCGRDPVTG